METTSVVIWIIVLLVVGGVATTLALVNHKPKKTLPPRPPVTPLTGPEPVREPAKPEGPVLSGGLLKSNPEPSVTDPPITDAKNRSVNTAIVDDKELERIYTAGKRGFAIVCPNCMVEYPHAPNRCAVCGHVFRK